MTKFVSQSYSQRASNFTNPTAKSLLNLIETKKTNLSVAADLTSKKEILELADKIGPYICVFKTHIDIVEDFDQDLVDQLSKLAEKHQFLIFEDRKFADIGNTVKLQYSSGVYHIASWSHITNAHPLPGEGIVQGLKEVGLPLSRGLLLLAEMSSAGSLAKGSYTDASIEMAKRHTDFVIGFISQRRLADDVDFIYMTPGVGLDVKGDGLGQQYRTPREVIVDSGCDVVIVGRGIYGKGKNPVDEAKRYRDAAWKAYLERLQK
ncbi:orotidine-5'-phosphate decarboxylase [Paraphysoderma sedebokerense]|nr:orotidine-5'-phosphate decarboxylase [Paraphysoderma sedebokerense]